MNFGSLKEEALMANKIQVLLFYYYKFKDVCHIAEVHPLHHTWVDIPLLQMSQLWKMGEDGLCCSSSAIQTRLDPSSLLEERSETSIVFVVSFVLSATPQTGGNGQGI